MAEESLERIAEERIEEAARTEAVKLSLSQLRLTRLPESIGQLTQLQELDLISNQLTALPESIGRLTNLRKLLLHSNRLSNLTGSISQLTNLRHLQLYGNYFTTLQESIGQLTQLRELGLGKNRLRALPDSICQLAQLRTLYLFENEFTSLSEVFGQLGQLRELNLSGNQLTALPVALSQLPKLKQLYLQGNDALGISPEILGPTKSEVSGGAQPANPADILQYYFRTQHEEKRALNEAKILLVGQGGVGKTSLVKRLVHGTYDPDESKTEGINIERWGIAGKGNGQAGDIRLNIWDFGGQEIMHATHQFFLTKRSVYLLVLDARKGENEGNIHYWLRIIQSYGGDSPVLIVTNKWEPPNQLQLNETRLQKDYGPNVKGFFQVSCLEETGLDKLHTAIEEHVRDLPHVYDEVPASYFSVKEKLEAEAQKRDYLDIGEYRELCSRHGVDDEASQNQLIRFLHDLGNVLNFDDPENPLRVRDTKVLDPEWVTDGVYQILNSARLVQSDAVLEMSELGEVLTDHTRYPAERQEFIVDMMKRFELCFAFPDSSGRRLLIPELLRPNEPDLNWGTANALNFQYHYKVLPDGLIPRFIVRMQGHFTEKQTYWRSGVVLSIEGCRVLVRGNSTDGQAYVSVQGAVAARRRGALAVVREAFGGIHATIPKIGAEERVPLPDAPGVTVGYAHLLKLEELGTDTYVPEGADEAYSVQDLLNGIEDKSKRDAERERRREGGLVQREKAGVPKPSIESSESARPKLDLKTFLVVGGFCLLTIFVLVKGLEVHIFWSSLLTIVLFVFLALFTGMFGEKVTAQLIDKVLGLLRRPAKSD